MLSVLITKTFGNKRSRKPKGQSRMDNTEILSKLGTQEIGRSQRKKSNIHSTLRYDLCIDRNQRVIELL
jgi:hypothetical protein